MQSRMRTPYSCGTCGVMGHTRRTCRLPAERHAAQVRGTPLTENEEQEIRANYLREFQESPPGIRWTRHLRELRQRAQVSQEQSRHIREAHEREARQRQAREQQAAQQIEAQQREARQQADFERFEQLEEQARQRLLARQRQQEAQAQAQQGDINISYTFNQLRILIRRAERETTNRIRQCQTQQSTKSLSLKMVSDFSNYQEDESDCCICCENEPNIGLPCNHSFCADCTIKFAKKKQICPMWSN